MSRCQQNAVPMAIGVMAFGFGALTIFSKFANYDHALRGFWSYRSATIGDAILLPLLTYTLMKSINAPEQFSRRAWVLIRLAGVSGLLVGASTNIYALLAPEQDLNWTHPADGVFNAPGWYHAAFLSVCAGFLSALFVAAMVQLKRRCRAAGEAQGVRQTLRVVGFTIVGFSLLLATDNVDASRGVRIGDASLPALALVVWVVASLLVDKEHDVYSFMWQATSAVIPALGLAIGALKAPQLSYQYATAVSTALLVGAIAAASADFQTEPDRQALGWRRGAVTSFFFVCLALGGPLIWLAAARETSPWIWAAVLALGALGACQQTAAIARDNPAPEGWPVQLVWRFAALNILFTWSFMWCAATGANPDYPGYTVLVVLLGIGFLATSGAGQMRELLAFVVTQELSQADVTRLTRAKFRAYGALVILLVLGLTMAAWVIASGQTGLTARQHSAPASGVRASEVLAAAILVAIVSAAVWVLRKTAHSEWFAIGAQVFAISALVALALRSMPWSMGYGEMLALWIAFWASAFAANGVWGHGGDRIGRNRSPLVISASLFAAIASFVVIAGLPVFAGFPSSASLTRIAASLGLCGAVVVGLSVTVTHVFFKHAVTEDLPPELATGVLQDSFLAFAMALIGTVIPLSLLALNASPWTTRAAVALIVAQWGSMALAEGMHRNKLHLEDQAGLEIGDRVPGARNVESLALHMRSQNLIAGVMLFPLVFWWLLNQFDAKAFTRAGIRDTLVDFVPRLPKSTRNTRAPESR